MILHKTVGLVALSFSLAVVSSITAARAQTDAAPVGTSAPAPTSAPDTVGPLTFKAGQTHYVKYPTLVPSTAAVLTIGPSGTSLYDTFNGLVRTLGWKCTSPQFYKAAVLDKSGGKEIHQLKISVQLDGNSPTGAPYIDCDGRGHPNNIYIVLETQPKVGDFVQVTVFGVDGKTEVLKSDGTLSMTATDIPTFSAVPQAAPGEALNNGATRTVGQLSVAFADMNLAPRSPVNVYAKTTDLLSTDGKDTKSAVALTAGLQRGVLPSWYSPISLEQTLQGNQTAQNLSTVTSLNFNALPPWKWSSGGLNNRVISAPLPPEPTIANLYTHRFEQLVTKKTPLLAVNDYSLNGSFAWDTISFPFTCGLLFWEKSANKSTPAINGSGLDTSNAKIPPVAAPATLAAPASTNCLGAEIDLGGWYLPLDLTTHGTQKFEGYGDVSILIPLSDFSVASSELLAVTKTDPTKFQVRIKWTDAVNAANGYARTRGWTFGLEAIK